MLRCSPRRASTSTCTSISEGLLPAAGRRRLVGFIQADQGISFQAMRQKLATFVEIVRADPAVENVVAFTGGGRAQRGLDVRRAEAAAERKRSADQ
jgi:multidrug efflux pump